MRLSTRLALPSLGGGWMTKLSSQHTGCLMIKNTQALHNQQQYRLYTGRGAFGYFPPPQFTISDYTPEELENRNRNAPLLRYVDNVRRHGHRAALIDPLDLMPREDEVRALDPLRYGLKPGSRYDVTGILRLPGKENGSGQLPLEEITRYLKKVYVDKLSIEFMHTAPKSVRNWIMDLVEDSTTPALITPAEQTRMHALLAGSETLEKFLQAKFPNVKRYGGEGAESMLPALDVIFQESAKVGIKSAVLCIAHRGRLSLLTELLGYPLEALFHKMKGRPEIPRVDPVTGEELIGATGDVLSHLVYEPTLTYSFDGETEAKGEAKREIKIHMLQNPSHLEAVNPVAMGKARARQTFTVEAIQRWRDTPPDATEAATALGDDTICVQVHGDAAITGQGIVMETLGLSELPHYNCGGSIHLVINNNIGYTTPSTAARSSLYASDIAKMIGAPVIHVNGDYPEEVVRATKLAVQIRQKFRRDVVIDLITYRRWGHNELDEPRFTQPKMYEKISSRASVPEAYEQRLITSGVLAQKQAERVRAQRKEAMEKALAGVDAFKPTADHLQGKWNSCVWPTSKAAVYQPDTGVEVGLLKEIGKASVTLPSDFQLHSRLKRHIKQRLASLAADETDSSKKEINWATAEALAFGSLLAEGQHVRLSGEDVQRGTFSQRHAAFVDQLTEAIHVPLNVAPLPSLASEPEHSQRGMLELANSSLSEEAVLGFEVGISWDRPDVLPIWEAQFGDFFNGAQVIIDTFIAGAEAKWLKQSALVMLLPHGFDGAGPEHSSCRIERFLQLSNDPFEPPSQGAKAWNPSLPFAYPTTPAQYFHLLRRQMKRNYRKPLIVAAPKGLLRSPLAASAWNEFVPGTQFHAVLDDPAFISADEKKEQASKMMLSSGKHYYALMEERAKRGMEETVALIRIEELSPFPFNELQEVLSSYLQSNSNKQVLWCQEEPRNQGAASHVIPRLQALLDRFILDQSRAPALKVEYRGRDTSSVVAAGVSAWHKEEVERLMEDTFA